MALARYQGTAVNTAGDVIANATVEVRRDQPGRPVVPLWADREGTQALGNPIQTDAQGGFAFHVVGGVYYIRIYTGPSQQPTFQKVLRYVAIGTAAERDVEELATALEAGTATFRTLPELQDFTPSGEGIGGKVTTGADAGFYSYDAIEEEWVFDRYLYDTLARMNVTGGTANAIEAEIVPGIPEASVVMLWIEAPATNTGPVTINGKPVLNSNDEALSAGQWVEGRTYWFSDEGTNYKLRTDSDVSDLVAQAEAAAEAALEAQAAAEAAAAGAGVTDGDKGDVIVSGAGTSWDVPGKVPDGGAEGAVLVKNSADDNDTKWEDDLLARLGVSPFAKTLLDDTNAASARITLGAVAASESDMFRGFLYAQNGSNPLRDIDIFPGICRDAGNQNTINLATALTKRCDQVWSVGNGGGLMDVTPATNFFWLHAIYNPTTGWSDAIGSTSLVSPTLPSGYVSRRVIGGFVYNTGAGLSPFINDGEWHRYKPRLRSFDSVANGAVATLRSLAVPRGAKLETELFLLAGSNAAGVQGQVSVRDPDLGSFTSTTDPTTGAFAVHADWYYPPNTFVVEKARVFTDNLGRVYSADNNGSAAGWITLHVEAWRLDRRVYL